MTDFGRALLDQLGPDDLERLAERLAPYLRLANGDGWLTSKQAADHLGISVHALHRLVAERRVLFSQSGPGARCYFRRADLDGWRQR